jgi:acylphosphatase
MARISVRVKITGLVHGVFFRASLARAATDGGVAGWVRNVPDGSVEAVLEGEEGAVMKVVDWAHKGPTRSRVDSVKVERQEPRDLKGFRIEG